MDKNEAESPLSATRDSEESTINLAKRFAFSSRFQTLFQDGMRLVEESASYLDDQGRVEAKAMSRATAMLYGAESMRLTTRLMQLASWLLLQRAANEGEMTRDQLLREKRKVKLETLPETVQGPGWEQLPQAFTALVHRSVQLQNRILSLDSEIYGTPRSPGDQEENPVSQQLNLLSTALGATRKN